MLGHGPWDLGWVEENAARIETTLLKILLSSAPGQSPNPRPWLFAPSGIGGHVDHVAIRLIVTRHYDRAGQMYRLGFYEDLHYASDFAARRAGFAGLLQAVPGKALHRHAWPLGDAVSRKLELIQLYAEPICRPAAFHRWLTPPRERRLRPMRRSGARKPPVRHEAGSSGQLDLMFVDASPDRVASQSVAQDRCAVDDGLVFLIGFIDYISGWEISWSVIYVIPITIAAWYIGTGFAYALSALSVILWLAGDFCNRTASFELAHTVWNSAIRLIFYYLIIRMLVYIGRLPPSLRTGCFSAPRISGKKSPAASGWSANCSR